MSVVTLAITKRYDCDVLVIGGGVGGFSAAVNAARSGAKVILAEKNGYLGGTATAGLIGTFMTCYDAKGEKRLIKGFYQEFVEEMVKTGGAIAPEDCLAVGKYGGYRFKGHFGVVPYEIEAFKKVSETLCKKAGVRLLYHLLLIGCKKEGKEITHAYFATGSDVYEISARVFIDATGDAYLCHKAGFSSEIGAADGEKQPASTFFTIKGVDEQMLDQHMANTSEMRARFFMDEIAAARVTGEYPCGIEKLRIFKSPGEKWYVNMAQVDEPLDQFDAEAVTEAEISQRQQIDAIVAFLRKHIPACRNVELVETAAEIGIREGRRVLGEYVLKKDDILSGRIFDDAICCCANSIDIHRSHTVAYTPTREDIIYTIPYRSLVVKEADNVLVAGRCLSAEREAMAAVRVMSPCVAMGEAAGIAAAIATEKDIAVRDVPYSVLREKLLANGAYLEEKGAEK